MTRMNGAFRVGYLCAVVSSTVSVLGYEENCDYLDKSRKDRTNHLQCNYGCCGGFKDRRCCEGPIAIVGEVFGAIVFLLFVTILVGVCYGKYKKKSTVKPVPTITTGIHNGIPEPTPPLPTPTVYNSSRLRPPPIITKAKFLRKTPVPPTATDLTSMNSSSSGTSTNKDAIQKPHSSDSTSVVRFQPVLNAPTTSFQNIPASVKERVYREHHPPPSELHLPTLTSTRK